MRPQVGNVIHNKYRLLRLIGDGGMGSVFEARHEVLGTTVALKFLHAELSRRQGLVQRFLQEARVSAQIQSANVVRVTDVDQTGTGLAFIVMELLEGKTLQSLYEELYKAGQRLSYADALEYAVQMLEGVAAAHRTGVVHRDLKPDNVMITRGAKGEPIIKLLDFGIAKLKVAGHIERGLTRPGVIMGTPEYMAPEQAYSADAVDSRADIFSLGVIIFEMLAGRRPVGGDEPQQIASAYLAGHVAELTELFPECPYDLAKAVHRAMAPLAKDRFASADAMRAEIEPFYAAIRPPPVSVQLSHASLSFARLTPVPQMSGVSGSTPSDIARVGNGTSAMPAAISAPPPKVDARPAAAPVAGSSDVSSTAADDPPVDSDVPSRQPTPLGGFQPYPPEAAKAAAARAAVPAPAPSAPRAASVTPARAAGAVAIPATTAEESPRVIEAPVIVSAPLPEPKRAAAPVNGAGTAEARPLFTAGGLGGGTAEASPLFEEPQPELGSSTVAMDEPYVASETSAPADRSGGTVAAYVDPLAPAAAPPAPAPAPSAAAPLPATKRSASKRKKKGMASLIIGLVLATGAASAVVGGVWAAQRMAHADDRDDANAVSHAPAPTQVRADPGPMPGPGPAEPASTTSPPAPVAPPQPGHGGAHTYPGSHGPGHPPVAPGSGRPMMPPPPPPSTQPPPMPPGLPPFVIPTALPFPFPGQSPAQQPPSPSPAPPSSGDPSRRHGGSSGRPPLVPIPRPGADPAQSAYMSDPPPYFRAAKEL